MAFQRSRYGAVDPTNPEAAARCDRGGEIRKLHELKKEMIWAGNRLVWNGFLCCDQHRDPPWDQDRLLILQPDPPPVMNPRPQEVAVFYDDPLTADDGVTVLTSDWG